MAFFDVTEKEIKEDILKAVKDNLETKNITNFNAGGIMRGFIEIVAYFIFLIYSLLNDVFNNAFATTATGKWLDAKCRDVALERKIATGATIYITFGRNFIKDTNVKIKAGSLIKTKTNYKGEEFFYQVVSECILLSGGKEVDVLCSSMGTGKKYNVNANTPLILVNTISGIDYAVVGQDKTVQYAIDPESDEELRERYFLKWTSLSVGGKDYYKAIALNVSGVKTATVFPTSRGAGTIDIVITGIDGDPSDALISEVQLVVNEGLQFDGIDVIVSKPFIYPIVLILTITVYYLTNTAAEFIQAVKDVLNSYFNNVEVGEDFIESRVKKQLLNSFENIKAVSFNLGDITLNNKQFLKVTIQTVNIIIEAEK